MSLRTLLLTRALVYVINGAFTKPTLTDIPDPCWLSIVYELVNGQTVSARFDNGVENILLYRRRRVVGTAMHEPQRRRSGLEKAESK
jgi:hypothetical protein